MKSSPKKRRKTGAEGKKEAMPLGGINYLMIALGTLIIIACYWGMYLEREVDGFFSLNIAPVLLVISYAGIALAIAWRPGRKARG